jgi:hypothetical protein
VKKSRDEVVAAFEDLTSTIAPLIADLATEVGYDGDSYPDPSGLVPYLDAFLSAGDFIERDAYFHMLYRVGVFVGQYLANELGGSWFFLDDPANPRSGEFMMGQFSPPVRPTAACFPFDFADELLRRRPRVALRDFLEEVTGDLLRAT